MSGMLISPSRARRWALEIARAHRAHKFTRVGRSFLDAAEAHARAFVRARVMQHPSKGRTLT